VAQRGQWAPGAPRENRVGMENMDVTASPVVPVNPDAMGNPALVGRRESRGGMGSMDVTENPDVPAPAGRRGRKVSRVCRGNPVVQDKKENMAGMGKTDVPAPVAHAGFKESGGKTAKTDVPAPRVNPDVTAKTDAPGPWGRQGPAAPWAPKGRRGNMVVMGVTVR